MAITHKHFRSTQEYAAWLDNNPAIWSDLNFGDDKRRIYEGINYLHNGKADVEAMHNLMESLELQLSLPTKVNRPSVRGHRVNMSGYLAGSPLSMMHREVTTSDHTPVRVWVCTTSSWSISPEQVTARGAALGAFALALSKVRPVYITPFVYGFGSSKSDACQYPSYGGALVSCDLQSSPLYVNELAAHMDSCVTRYVGLNAVWLVDNRCRSSSLHQDAATMQRILGVQPNDLYIPGIHLHDPLLADPVAWIKHNLAKYMEVD